MTETKLKNRRLGYARESMCGQAIDAQLPQLRKEGCTRMYREKSSGAQANRRELLRLLKATGSGDLVTVTRIDQLARSTFELFAIVTPAERPPSVAYDEAVQIAADYGPLRFDRAKEYPYHRLSSREPS